MRYKTIIADLKTNDPLCYQFICVFFFRRALYASILIIFESKSTLQIVSANLVTLLMVIYLVIIKPYRATLSNFLSVSNEILFL